MPELTIVLLDHSMTTSLSQHSFNNSITANSDYARFQLLPSRLNLRMLPNPGATNLLAAHRAIHDVALDSLNNNSGCISVISYDSRAQIVNSCIPQVIISIAVNNCDSAVKSQSQDRRIWMPLEVAHYYISIELQRHGVPHVHWILTAIKALRVTVYSEGIRVRAEDISQDTPARSIAASRKNYQTIEDIYLFQYNDLNPKYAYNHTNLDSSAFAILIRTSTDSKYIHHHPHLPN
ncbi:uncharacterized protein MELLADRAFT_114364 [Melampsora larici-populina 98AG31]|uniref:Uncharacterized protein n=1 Tax=Melampsora larici-populina (strain 98AG31 / pathotype 3-4-7) TaxID=747676 RepID=F4SD67_MELLP|nr:uncharacterized protein MELLADRAFT_114364 [Melampsora larici-populina 98AG31]EGF97400.1 hypothetical protein MELLADRAFT_114364 [Melampsora larici-populina 98AG31]